MLEIYNEQVRSHGLGALKGTNHRVQLARVKTPNSSSRLNPYSTTLNLVPKC
jgi:hypothetical protein